MIPWECKMVLLWHVITDDWVNTLLWSAGIRICSPDYIVLASLCLH